MRAACSASAIASAVVTAPTWTITGNRPAADFTTRSAMALRSSIVKSGHWPVEPTR